LEPVEQRLEALLVEKRKLEEEENLAVILGSNTCAVLLGKAKIS
jgi:hypothetical protein